MSTPHSSQPSSGSNGEHRFATTQWSLVIAAGHDTSESAQVALASLCQSYWYPLYAYVRRKGYQVAEAQDLTQSFLVELLEKEKLQVADPQRGRFRSFLLSSLNHFLANQHRDARAQKRGGGKAVLSLDFDAGESRYQIEPAHDVTAEKIFERRWAMTLLENAISRLRQEFEDAGKLQQFEQLKSFLGGSSESISQQEVATQLGMTEGAVKVAVHRLRRRCGECLRAEIAQTVASPNEIDEELRHLFEII